MVIHRKKVQTKGGWQKAHVDSGEVWFIREGGVPSTQRKDQIPREVSVGEQEAFWLILRKEE